MRNLYLVFIGVLGLSVLAGCGAYGTVDTGVAGGGGTIDVKSMRAVDTDFVGQDLPDEVAERAGCREPEAVRFGNLEHHGAEHVDEDVDYEDNPPASGPHDPVALDWGVYEDEQPTERWVHNLEHGHVVIAHKGLSEAQLGEVLDIRARAPWHIVVLPREANDDDGVWLLAWDARLYCERPDAEAFQWFVDNFRDRGPELIMSAPPRDPEEIEQLVQDASA